MFTRGYAKPPCTRLAYIHGLAVDRVRPYRCTYPMQSALAT